MFIGYKYIMSENTKISWCDHTVNLWWGCSKVHTGCKNCYAETLSKRFDNDIWGVDKPRKLIKSAFKDLDKYQKQAKEVNKKVTVFVGSMMDIFENEKSLINPIDHNSTYDLRWKLFNKISNNEYNNIIFLLLTKRPQNIENYIPHEWFDNLPKNVWVGTSVSNNKTLQYIYELKKQWKGHKFISFEPQVAEIKNVDLNDINWVIQGCESGANRRHFEIEWAYKIKNESKKLGIPYFLKQIQDNNGNVIKDISKFPNDLQYQELPIW